MFNNTLDYFFVIRFSTCIATLSLYIIFFSFDIQMITSDDYNLLLQRYKYIFIYQITSIRMHWLLEKAPKKLFIPNLLHWTILVARIPAPVSHWPGCGGRSHRSVLHQICHDAASTAWRVDLPLNPHLSAWRPARDKALLNKTTFGTWEHHYYTI